MSRPVVPDVTEVLYDELQVAQPGDEQRGWTLLIVLGAIGTIMGRVAEVVRDNAQGLGWTMLLDPARCPAWALAWLAQFAGVRRKVEAAPDEATKRALITSPPTFSRGTRRAIKDATALTLTGTKTVRLVSPVDGNAYQRAVITAPAETPDPAATAAAALSQTPFWVVEQDYVSATPLLMEYTRPLSAITATVATAALADVT